MLQFEPEQHVYTLDGQVLPSVTQILEPLVDYSKIPFHVMENARQRGEYVHNACELYCWGTLDEDSIEPEYQAYIDAFKRFMDETGFQPELVEQTTHHAKLKYAGMLDIGGTLPPRGRMKKPRRAWAFG